MKGCVSIGCVNEGVEGWCERFGCVEEAFRGQSLGNARMVFIEKA